MCVKDSNYAGHGDQVLHLSHSFSAYPGYNGFRLEVDFFARKGKHKFHETSPWVVSFDPEQNNNFKKMHNFLKAHLSWKILCNL